MRLFQTKRRRRAAWVLAGILLLLLAAFGLAYQAAPYMILTPRKFNLRRTPADLGLPFEKVALRTADSLLLRGYWIHQQGDTGRTVVLLLHGVGGCKEQWLNTAAWLWQAGYETLLVDSRAHGESEGRFCTYGFHERHDVAAWADYLLLRNPGGRIGVWGNSMGGAIAVQALAAEPRLAFGVVESTFADFRTIVFDYQRRRLKIPWQWFADDAIARARELTPFEPDSIRPAVLARRIRQPVFLAHGDADDRIKVAYGRQIFANLATPEKELHIVAGADHFDVMQRGGETYKNTLLAFLQRQRENL